MKVEGGIGGAPRVALLVFAGSATSAFVFTRMGASGAVLFPSYAILTVALLVLPPRRWWVAMVASAAGNFLPHLATGSIEFVLLTELANFARALVVAVVLRRFASASAASLETLRGMFVFLVSAVCVGPAVGAVIGTFIVLRFHGGEPLTVWATWFSSNALTALTFIVPLWFAASRVALPPGRKAGEAIALAAGLVSTSSAAFILLPRESAFLLMGVCWPLLFLLWAAVRFGSWGLSVSLLATTALMLVGATRGNGPFVGASSGATLLHLQLFVVITAVPLFVVSALVGHVARATAKEARQRAELDAQREDERTKNELIALLGHELRGPLAPISASLALLGEAHDPTERADARAMIARNVAHMGRLIDDLVDLSRVARGELRLVLAPMDLADTARHAARAVRAEADARRHELVVTTPDDPVPTMGDEVRLTQVLVNLLTNAIKYTEPGGHITLDLSHEDGTATLVVKDDGAGIPEGMHERVFDAFARGPAAATIDGLGLGLTVSRKIVVLHDGAIEARCPERGSELVVRLPLRAATLPAKSEPPVTASRSPRRDVLVVDDNADSVQALALLLRAWGHTTRTARDGEEALTLLRERTPDVVLSDLTLPGIDGFELARRVRADPTKARVLLVAITGLSTGARERSMSAGFDHHFAKPIDIERLEALLIA